MTAIPSPTAASPSSTHAYDLHDCLPDAFREPSTTITRIAAGLSGAGVFRVEGSGQSAVLKVTAATEPLDAWRRALDVQQLAAAADIAPRVLHVDEPRRAVLSEMIVDRSFAAHAANPATRSATLGALGRMLATLHALPIPADAVTADPRAVLSSLWHQLDGLSVPTFVGDAVESVLRDPPPATGAIVLSHNDVNPTNVIFDGIRVLLLDWQTAAPNDSLFDLGTIAMFLRLDDTACRGLLSAYRGVPVDVLPPAFMYFRRCAAVLSGVASMIAARGRGHTGGEETLATTPDLGVLYVQMRNGTFALGSASGQWTFGLALVKDGVAQGA